MKGFIRLVLGEFGTNTVHKLTQAFHTCILFNGHSRLFKRLIDNGSIRRR